MLNGIHRYPRQEEVVYGRPAAETVAARVDALGAKRVMIVTSRSLAAEGGIARRLAAALGEHAIAVFAGVRAHSPRQDVIDGAMSAMDSQCDLIVAIGGGSVIDAAKVMQLCVSAGVRSAPGLEAFRAGSRVATSLELRVRMIAVPTTLSAAEFTPFAGVTDAERHVKEGYYHPLLAPRTVVLDPAITLETPAGLWFSTGIKAVDHAVEQLCNPERAPFADALAEAGLRRISRALRESKQRPLDLDARLECQLGMWLAISGAAMGRGMGASHAIGHTLGGLLGIPHGLTSAVVLPAVLRWNRDALGARDGFISELLGAPELSAADAVSQLCRDLDLPGDLRSVGVEPAQFRAIAEHTMHDRGVRTNARPINSAADIEEILSLASP